MSRLTVCCSNQDVCGLPCTIHYDSIEYPGSPSSVLSSVYVSTDNETTIQVRSIDIRLTIPQAGISSSFGIGDDDVSVGDLIVRG